ncbi:MAG: MFS transporter, partial [Calditrichaeota bacterium]|nr:MFS transporter [Calditrichota bacterium]
MFMGCFSPFIFFKETQLTYPTGVSLGYLTPIPTEFFSRAEFIPMAKPLTYGEIPDYCNADHFSTTQPPVPLGGTCHFPRRGFHLPTGPALAGPGANRLQNHHFPGGSLRLPVFADRFNRRSVMMFSDAARMVVMLALVGFLLAGGTSPVIVGLIAFVVASFATLFYPARDALVPDLVPPTALTSANAFISTSGQFAHLAGPLLAGLLVASV